MTTSKKWLKITIPCREKMSEAVSDMIGVLSGAGVEIHPDEQSGLNDISGFFFMEDFNSATSSDTIATIQANISAELKKLFSLYNESLPELTVEIFDDQEWATSWQQYFKTFEIVPGLIIKPSWEAFTPAQNQHLLEMDPGMAFGTGQHESTRLALSLLTSCLENNREKTVNVLDVGTGTGILAMAAALFGAGQITAIDNDPEAVAVAKNNILHNKLAGQVTVSATPLAEIEGVFDLICANIVHDVLVDMAPDFSRLIAPAGYMVLAGILSGKQAENISALYGQYGIQTITENQEGKWTGMLLQRRT